MSYAFIFTIWCGKQKVGSGNSNVRWWFVGDKITSCGQKFVITEITNHISMGGTMQVDIETRFAE